MELIRPGAEHLSSYLDALRRGWSPNTEHVGLDQAAIDRVMRDPQRFVDLCDDREAAGGPIELPDGTTVPRLPGLSRWMWDGEFAGAINLRWQPGTRELPPTCLVHSGFAGAVEAPAGLCDRCTGRDVSHLAAAEGPTDRGRHYCDLDKDGITASDPRQWRRPGREVHEAGVRRGRSRPALRGAHDQGHLSPGAPISVSGRDR